MRLNNVFSGRPAFYDRNPLNVGTSFNAFAVGPAGLTNHTTFTVPTGKKAYIPGVMAEQSRRTVATTMQTNLLGISATLSGNGIDLLQVTSFNNVVGDKVLGTLGLQLYALAGDVITTNSQDASTGGTVDQQYTLPIWQFDA